MTLSKKEISLSLLRTAGYHNNKAEFTRLYIDKKVSLQVANEQWRIGSQQKRNGVKCSCFQCL